MLSTGGTVNGSASSFLDTSRKVIPITIVDKSYFLYYKIRRSEIFYNGGNVSDVSNAPTQTFGQIARGTVERLRPNNNGTIILRDDAEYTVTLYPSGKYQVSDKQSLCLFTFEVFADNSFREVSCVTGLTRHNIPYNRMRAEFALKAAIARRRLIGK
jgi:hypothetical protein